MLSASTLFHVTAQAGLGGLFLIIPVFPQALALDVPQPNPMVGSVCNSYLFCTEVRLQMGLSTGVSVEMCCSV